MNSDDLRKAMQQAGVEGAPDVQYIEDVRTVHRSRRPISGSVDPQFSENVFSGVLTPGASLVSKLSSGCGRKAAPDVSHGCARSLRKPLGTRVPRGPAFCQEIFHRFFLCRRN